VIPVAALVVPAFVATAANPPLTYVGKPGSIIVFQ
jgi:hypothetical protein